MLCATLPNSGSASVSTDAVSCASTDDVSNISTDDVSDVSTDDVSDVSTDNVSASCVSVHNAMLCTTPTSCSSFLVPHKAAILGTGRILAKLCRLSWKLLSGKV